MHQCLDDSKREQFIIENQGLLVSFVNKYCLKYLVRFEYDDLCSIAKIGLIKAADTYDESKGKFSTYAYTCMQREFSMFFRRLKTRDAIRTDLSLDEALNDETEHSLFELIGENDYNEQLDIDDLMNFTNEYLKNKSDSRKRVIIMFVQHALFKRKQLKQRELVKLCNVSQPQISRYLQDYGKALQQHCCDSALARR